MSQPILFSWIAWNNDYEYKTNNVDPKGPNNTIHQHFYPKQKYQKHYLLTSAASREADGGRSEKLAKYLNHQYADEKHKVELLYLDIENVIDPEEIISKVQPLLFEQRAHEVHAFISTGTPMMQVAWVSLYMAKAIPHLRLIQGVEASKTKSKFPEFNFREFTQSQGVRALFVKSTESIHFPESDEGFFEAEILKPIYKKAAMAAAVPKREISVLIQGESGTGKEHLAQFMHQASARKNKKFIAVNCASMGDHLLESRLFGYVKGAFTDAREDCKGYFEDCDGGTLFLDEIGDTSPQFQQSLLRVLQEGVITRVGSTTPIKVDVKTIAATHKHLKSLCEESKFRWDLYYRLTTVELKLPPLRHYAKNDREGILNHLISSRADFFEKKPLELSKEVKTAFMKYSFPGNIRELQHMIDRCYIFCEDEAALQEIPEEITRNPQEFSWKMDDIKKTHVTKALTFFDYNLSRTADELDISYNTLVKHIKTMKIDTSKSKNPLVKVGKRKIEEAKLG
ncbi:sigma 54-interacting transcriptional regulator [Rufibacter tibetensis]|uniref:sigma 54-interacting transcriptional regulator n=1 Tax=Rufibacter tibetensis TaxID=512763 RepID=UPI00078368C7|nr:sigma 54-interacting transcriptional regulator [Rufibacter tibetensis]